MNIEKISSRYCIQIEEDAFEALLDYENAGPMHCVTAETSLSIALEEIGCVDVDYDQHYPGYISFSIDIEDDCLALKQTIKSTIDSYLDRVNVWKQRSETTDVL